MKQLSCVDLSNFDTDNNNRNVIVEILAAIGTNLIPTKGAKFKLAKVLPEGMVSPFEFGFIPSTRGEEGSARYLVLIDGPTTTGCLVTARPVGVIEAKQTEGAIGSRRMELDENAVAKP
jgi:inorganic pyrophosphatase